MCAVLAIKLKAELITLNPYKPVKEAISSIYPNAFFIFGGQNILIHIKYWYFVLNTKLLTSTY